MYRSTQDILNSFRREGRVASQSISYALAVPPTPLQEKNGEETELNPNPLIGGCSPSISEYAAAHFTHAPAPPMVPSTTNIIERVKAKSGSTYYAAQVVERFPGCTKIRWESSGTTDVLNNNLIEAYDFVPPKKIKKIQDVARPTDKRPREFSVSTECVEPSQPRSAPRTAKKEIPCPNIELRAIHIVSGKAVFPTEIKKTNEGDWVVKAKLFPEVGWCAIEPSEEIVELPATDVEKAPKAIMLPNGAYRNGLFVLAE